MTYEAWRITFQSSEQAARAAYAEVEKLRAEVAREAALRDALEFVRPMHEAAAGALVGEHGDEHREAVRKIDDALAAAPADHFPEVRKMVAEAPAEDVPTVPVPRVVAWSGGKAPYKFLRVILDDTPTEHEYVPRESVEAPAPAEAPAVHCLALSVALTADDIEALDEWTRVARESGRREGREEAAKVAEGVAKQYGPAGCHPIERAVNAIRALP